MELVPLEMEQAYLKQGILGFQGAGKTFTGANIAIGLHDYIKSTKPIAFISTEPGVDFLVNDFKQLGKQLIGGRTKAFVDLLDLTRKAEKSCDILLIDSITHFHDELVKAYQKKLNRQRLRVQDWGPIKTEWGQFTDLFVNSKVHIIMMGRAAWTFDSKEDEDGVTQFTKTGTRMRTDKELGYEPSLLIEMEQVREENGKIGQKISHRAWVLKDRFNQINGRCFDFKPIPGKLYEPKIFETFLPHISRLNIGGIHSGADLSRNSQGLFDNPESRTSIHKRREIALESIQNELTKRISGRTAKDQQAKIKALEDIFGTNSWTAISDLHPDKLEEGLKKIQSMKMESEVSNG